MPARKSEPNGYTTDPHGTELYGVHTPTVADDGQTSAAYNTERGRSASASTSGTPRRVTPVASDAERKIPAAYVKRAK